MKIIKMFSKSIKVQMMALFCTLILIVCVGMGFMSNYLSSKALINNTDKLLPQLASKSALVLQSRLVDNFSDLNNISQKYDTIKNNEIAVSNLIRDEKIKGKYELLGIANTEGEVIASDRNTYNVKDLDFFKKAIMGENTVSDPIKNIFDESSTDLIVVYAIPFSIGSYINKVLIAVKPGDEFSLQIQDITFGESGNAFLVNSKGDIIAHTDSELVYNKTNFITKVDKDKSYKDLTMVLSQMIEGNIGTGKYTYEGKEKYAGYAPIQLTGWSIAISGETNEIFSDLNVLKKNNVILAILLLVIGAFAVFIISNKITQSLGAMVKQISIMAKGDLTNNVQEKYRKKQNEIGVLAKSIFVTQNSIRDMLNNVKDSSFIIEFQTESLSEISKNVSLASENVTTSIQEVAKGAGIQAEGLSRMMDFLNQFASELDKITESINGVEDNAKNISLMAEDSSNNMQQLENSSNSINDSFKNFTNKISGFGNNIAQINEIAESIKGIADETKLLSFNASIEAARAGDYGRGFAVVADHIKKLAEQTTISLGNINIIINGIYTQTETMMSDTNILGNEQERQAYIIQNCIYSFEKIINAINVVIPEIIAVNNSTLKLNNEKNKLVHRVEEDASIAQEVSASAEEIAATSEEMYSSMEEVGEAVEVLSGKTKVMKDQIDKFKI